MPSYGPEPESTGGRSQIALAIVCLLLALTTTYLPDVTQERVAWTLRGTVLAPFLTLRQGLADARLRATRVDNLRRELDSLAAQLSTQSALVDENRTLRDLLALGERAGPSFVPATIIRSGTVGSESMFLIELGAGDGIRVGAPVISRQGLVGMISGVREDISMGMDWTHPDFRASGMLADGATYGIVEPVRGAFREEDRMLLNGTPYHEESQPGSEVLTSGLGVFPRGIPIGVIDEVADQQGGWLKSYWLRPRVEPASVTHALVAVVGAGQDIAALWADSLWVTPDSLQGGLPRPEGLDR